MFIVDVNLEVTTLVEDSDVLAVLQVHQGIYSSIHLYILDMMLNTGSFYPLFS